MQTHNLTIRGGLKVAVSYVVFPPEPDVGLFYPYPEVAEIWVYDRKGMAKPADWLLKSMTHFEWQNLLDSLPCG